MPSVSPGASSSNESRDALSDVSSGHPTATLRTPRPVTRAQPAMLRDESCARCAPTVPSAKSESCGQSVTSSASMAGQRSASQATPASDTVAQPASVTARSPMNAPATASSAASVVQTVAEADSSSRWLNEEEASATMPTAEMLTQPETFRRRRRMQFRASCRSNASVTSGTWPMSSVSSERPQPAATANSADSGTREQCVIARTDDTNRVRSVIQAW